MDDGIFCWDNVVPIHLIVVYARQHPDETPYSIWNINPLMCVFGQDKQHAFERVTKIWKAEVEIRDLEIWSD